MLTNRVLFQIDNPIVETCGNPYKLRSIPCLLSVHIETHNEQWSLDIRLGRGAGYILGRSLYIARNCQDRSAPLHSRKRKPLQIGFTQNANIIPYCNF